MWKKLQSDWHQAGREHGYAENSDEIFNEIKQYDVPDSGDWSLKALIEAGVPERLRDQWYDNRMKGKMPDAPFKKKPGMNLS